MAAETVGLIGLGLLGGAIAERLLLSGYEVLGYDVDLERQRELAKGGGRPATSAIEVAQHSERMILSLPGSNIVEAVLQELTAVLRSGLKILDTTTGEPERTARFGKDLFQQGVHYLDATISGSSEQVRKGDVIVMVGGERNIGDSCADIFESFARAWYHVGPWGSGARMKLVVNLVLGLNRAALAEGLAFARASGLDLSETLQVLRDGAAYSKAMDVKGRKMIERDFATQAKLSQHLKDVRLILAEARRVGAKAPMSALHHALLTQLENEGIGGLDNSAVFKAFD
jgi:3-hydroxyisobutyrate dehydrogenase-like beta-hydroxyacid dehydrogenase